MLNEDYRDMLQALVDEKVRFLLVGAYALAAHGYPRATMDIDIWVMPVPDNADAVLRALGRFGAPLHNLTKGDLEKEGTVFQIGMAPRRIDIITTASGLQFESAFRNSIAVDIDGIEVRIPSVSDLIRNKRESGRTKDLADAEALEELGSFDPSPSERLLPNDSAKKDKFILRENAVPCEARALSPFKSDAWLKLSPAERLERSWRLRKNLPDPAAVHDQKLFPKP